MGSGSLLLLLVGLLLLLLGGVLRLFLVDIGVKLDVIRSGKVSGGGGGGGSLVE